MSGRVTHLHDQQAAAARTARRLARDLVADGVAVQGDGTAPSVGALVRELGARLAAGSAAPCRHLRPEAVQVVHWLAWAPGRLLCHGCAVDDARAVRGTSADRLCDGCGEVDVDLAPVLVASGFVLVSAGLCARCLHRGRLA